MRSFQAGWSREEEAALFDQVRRARQEGRPLKTAFADMAALSGRKPNSIRNYYYLRLREDPSLAGGEEKSSAFVPFRPEEERALVRNILLAREKGLSVRSCSLSMARGDEKGMLRYQNKYRALLKSDPALIRAVRTALLEEGHSVPDPYAPSKKATRAGRPRKISLYSPKAGTLLRIPEKEAAAKGETELQNIRERFDRLLELVRQLLLISRSLLCLCAPLPGLPEGLLQDLSQSLEDSEERLARIL